MQHHLHDKFFKNFMTQKSVAQDFFKRYLPEDIIHDLDLSSLVPHKRSFVKNTNKDFEADIIYQARWRGEETYLVLLVEHQRTARRFMPLRILNYMLCVWMEWSKQFPEKLLPMIFPLMYFNGDKPFDGSLDLRDLLNAPQALVDRYLYQPSRLIDLNHECDSRINNWLDAMNQSMRSVPKEQTLTHIIKTYHEAFQLMEQESVALLPQLFQYLMNRYGSFLDINKLEAAIEKLSNKEGIFMRSFVQQWEERGRGEGLQKGLEEGQLTQQISIAKALLNDNIPVSQVAVYCKLSEGTVKRIQNNEL